MSLLRTGTLLTLFKLVNSALGLLLVALLADGLGAGRETDALFVALFLSVVMAREIGQRVRAALVPCLVEEDESGGTAFVDSFATYWVLFSLAACLAAFAAAPALVGAISPGFDPETGSLTVDLLRCMSPCLFLHGMSAAREGALLARRRFFRPEVGQLLWRATALGSLCFVRSYGVYAYAFGVVCASSVQMVFLFLAARGTGLPAWGFLPRRGSLAVLRPLFDRAAIGLVLLMLVKIRAACTRTIVSFMAAGSVSILTYSSRIVYAVPQLVAASMFTMFLPEMSRVKARGGDLSRYVSYACRLLLACGIPMGMVAFWGAPEITSVLLGHGRFTADNATVTAGAIRIFGTAAPALFLLSVMRGSFMIDRRIREVVEAGILNICVFLAGALALGRWGLPGVVAAISVAAWTQSAYLWWRRRLPLRFDGNAGRQLLALALMAAVLYVIPWRNLFSWPLLRLCFACGAACAVYAVAAYPLVKGLIAALKPATSRERARRELTP